MAYTSTGGAGGGTSVVINKDVNIISSDNSVGIQDSESNNVKTFDLKVEDFGDVVEIGSADGTIQVTETEGEQGEKIFDLKVDQNNLDLVTENQNGLARYVDKKTVDKTIINSVAHFDRTQYNSANEASEALATLTDNFYSPVHLSMISWIGIDGKNNLSRYIDNSRLADTPYSWDNIKFGIVNGEPVWLAMAFNKTGSTNGANALFARSTDGYNWQLVESSLSVENWIGLDCVNGYFFAGSVNDTAEMIYSADGGLTWDLITMMNPNGSVSNNYMFSVKGTNNKCFYLGMYALFEIDFTTNPVSQIRRPFYSSSAYDITSDDNYYYIVTDNGVYKYTLEWQAVSTSNNIAIGFYIDYINSVLVVTAADGRYYTSVDAGNTWTEHNYFFNENILISRIVYGSGYYVCVSTNGSLYYSSDLIQWTSKTYIQTNANNNVFVSVCFDGENFQIISGTFGPTREILTANCTLKVRPVSWELLNKFWQEIPILLTTENKLLQSSNDGFANVDLGVNLDLSDNILSVNQSDRFSNYLNYRCVSLSDNATYNHIWCAVDRDSILDNNTNVYADEECTQVIGIIKSHNYNVNNLNHILVTIDNNDYTYYFFDSKVPVSIATTKALIAGLSSVSGGVPHSSVDGQIFRTVLNETTQALETAWTSEWISGFEPFSFLDAQEVGIPYQVDVTSALLVRFLPDSRSVLNSVSFVITQGAQKEIKLAIYDENRNLLATTDSMTMENSGMFTLVLNQNVKVYPDHSYFIGVMTTGNGYLLLGRNITIGTNNILPCCFQSQNNLQNGVFPTVFENAVVQGNNFIPYLQANGLY